MATMKAEFLAHHYAGRLRPRSHYSMGWLPAAAQLASRAPRLVNALTQPERVLLPAVRDATADSFVLADGFSCRTQIEQAGTGRTPVHLAEILAAGRHVAGSGAAVAALLAGRPKRG